MKIVELYIHSVQDVLKVEGEHRKGSSGVRRRGVVPDVTVPADRNIAFNRPKSEMSKVFLLVNRKG